MQLGDRLSKNKERGREASSKGVCVEPATGKIKHTQGDAERVGA